MTEKLKPVDIVAILLIIGAYILKCKGLDGDVSIILATVAAYYLGHGRIITNQTQNNDEYNSNN